VLQATLPFKGPTLSSLQLRVDPYSTHFILGLVFVKVNISLLQCSCLLQTCQSRTHDADLHNR